MRTRWLEPRSGLAAATLSGFWKGGVGAAADRRNGVMEGVALFGALKEGMFLYSSA